MTTLPSLNYETAIPTYTQLLFKDPPKQIEGFQWSILEPLTDSADLAMTYFDDLLKLNFNRDYRVNVIQAASNIAQTSKSKEIVIRHLGELLKYANEDLDYHIEQRRDSLGETYLSSSLLFAYTELMQALAVNHEVVDTFTKNILNSEVSTWYEEEAVAIRILSDLEIDPDYIQTYTDSLGTRFTTLTALHRKNRLNEVDKRYYSEESMAQMSLYEYLEYEDYTTDDMEFLGMITKDEDKYRAMKLSYRYDDGEEHYLALVGPIADVTQTTELEKYSVLMNWDPIAEDWKQQSMDLLLDIDESEDD